ncbi:MAG TPA: enoyl-CoA hydratase/isomerase family protein, partial [Burkholderiaceae bacterium]|nr:enoyl-CoA hydratase/isomerase family protein [Burkholderiaceae bacterium]
GSPTAAHVTFEYLRRTRQMSIAEVLELDLVMARRFQRLHDFTEGVRALLIDKDRAPKWSPASFDEVTEELVASHFIE